MDFEADIFSEEDFSEYSVYLDEVNFPVPPRDYVPVSSCVVKNVPEPPEPYPIIGGARFPYFDLILPEIINEGCSICTASNDEINDAPCDTERVIMKEESASEINNEDVTFIASQPPQIIPERKISNKKTVETHSTVSNTGAKSKSESYHKSKERKKGRKKVSTGSSYVSDTEEFDYNEELKQYRQHRKKVHQKLQNAETDLEAFSALKIKAELPAAVDQISKEKKSTKVVQKEVAVIESRPSPSTQASTSKYSNPKKNFKGSSQGAKVEEEKATCALPTVKKSYSPSRQGQSSAKRYDDKKGRKRYSSSSEEEYEPHYYRSRPYSVYSESDYGNYDDDEVFYCEFCHKSMNSRKTWECHVVGKKHLKAMKLANPEQMASEAVPMLTADISKRLLVKGPPPGYQRITRNQPSKIQRIVDKVTQVCPGFETVIELIGPQTDYCYYCEMCDAICMANSIIGHVASYKHKLNYLKYCDPKMYDSVHLEKKPKVEKKLNQYFTRYETRGKIRVQEDVPTRNYNPDLPGPSSAFSGSSFANLSSSEAKASSEIIEVDPETSKGDYFCTVCNSHMNSHNMWISHVNGKRHIKNVKKAPGELPSKVKFIKSNERAWLLSEINKSEEVIAGLGYISEKRLETGSATYACYLCHSNCTAGDIIEHLKTLKHMMKYLEKEHAKKASDLKTLTMHMSPFSMKALYTEACSSVIAEKGLGEIEVLIPKC